MEFDGPMFDSDNLIVSDKELAASKKILKALRVAQSVRFGPGITAEVIPEIEFNNVRLSFEKEIISDRLAEDEYSEYVIIKTPASPWQFFKERHMDSWFMRQIIKRRPIVYDTKNHLLIVKVERHLTYPEAVIPSDRLGQPVIFEQVSVRSVTE